MTPAAIHEVRPAYQRPAADVVAALGTNAHAGLTEVEARARLARDGANELLAERPVPAWRKFLAQFLDPLVILLLVATAISAGLWFYERDSALPYEALAILAVVLLNAILGHAQAARAASAVAALRQMAAARAHVIRDGERKDVLATEIVTGDIIVVEEGDTVPADARLLVATALQVAESALTGESLPVAKDTSTIAEEVAVGDRHDMLLSGTAVTYGHGRAVVVATGMLTELGTIAGLLKQTRVETTPLQKELARVGRVLGIVVVAIAVVMIVTLLLIEDVHGFAATFDILILGVALAVAAVPEGLPAVVTAVLSLGVQRAARKHAIVRHLSAVETLGSATIIASDKTGTLTKNEMTVRTVVTASGRVGFSGTGYEPVGEVTRIDGAAITGPLQIELERTLSVADRANNAVLQEHDGQWTVQGDPTEGALIVAARKAGLEADVLGARFGRIAEVPFSSQRKLMSTVHSDAEREERLLAFTKGAPDVLLGRCTSEQVGDQVRVLDAARRAEIMAWNDTLADEALRTLGMAYRSLPKDAFEAKDVDEDVEEELIFLGLIGMLDPPREEAKDAVARTRAAGIRPIMITGDHPRTAVVIAVELGIVDAGARAVSGPELAAMSDDQLDRVVEEVSVYARVNPEHKLRIVKALQRGGEVVAMTGDGVNDAPALKSADIGVAMGITGTDVSKEAADIVLTDDNFATIVGAVEEGRAIYANIRKFLRYLLASNIGEVMTMFFGVVFAKVFGLGGPTTDVVALPLLATQLLWLNLATDGAPALALGLEPPASGLMAAPPRPRDEGVITRHMWGGILFIGCATALATLLVLDASLPGGLIEGVGTLPHARTMAFTTLVFCSMITIFSARSDEQSAFERPFSNGWLWSSVALALLLQVAVVYVPFLQRGFSTTALSLGDWGRCAAAGGAVLVLRELSKVVVRWRRARAR